MTFYKFSKFMLQLEQTSSRNEMVEILSEIFKNTGSNEIGITSFLLMGKLGPKYMLPSNSLISDKDTDSKFNMAEKMVVAAISLASGIDKASVTEDFKKKGDLGDTVFHLLEVRNKSSNTVSDVYRSLYDIAGFSGTGSQSKKIRGLANLLRASDRLSAKYIVRIVLSTLRLGFSEQTLFDSFSFALVGDKSAKSKIESVYNLFPNIGVIAEILKRKGIEGLSDISLQLGVPLIPQLCQRENNASRILERHNGCTLAEPKLDGTRVQLHFDKDKLSENINANQSFFETDNYFIRTFTRNLEENTYQYPEIKEAVTQLNLTSVIFDGEALGIDAKTGRFLPFQKTITRKRKYGVDQAAKEVSLVYVIFDILFLNGESLIHKSLLERRGILADTLKKSKSGVLKLGEQHSFKKAQDLKKYFLKQISQGGEGLVCKDPLSKYTAGSRGFSWLKYKYEKESDLSDTLDCVIMGIYRGRGDRSEFGVGAFLVGVFDKNSDTIKSVAKIGTGLTDDEWRYLNKLSKKLAAKSKPVNYNVNPTLEPDVWLSPDTVVSVRADNITKSPLHSAGLALRFPRLMGWREDKSFKETTSLEELYSLANL